MKVSYVGYKTISRLVTIGRMGIIRMQADAYQLKRVVVKGNLRTDRGDHAIYTFNEEQIKNARHTQDLITATGYWLLNDAKYKFETIDNPILSRKEWHTIKDNNRMVSIGVSWNFFSGKKKDIQKHINNRDGDSGAFK